MKQIACWFGSGINVLSPEIDEKNCKTESEKYIDDWTAETKDLLRAVGP